MAALEGCEAAYATASRMAAIHGALLAAGVRAGARVVASQDCYGATYALLDGLLREQGVQTHFADPTDLTYTTLLVSESPRPGCDGQLLVSLMQRSLVGLVVER